MNAGGQFEFDVTFTEFVYGCGDELANNYDETVTVLMLIRYVSIHTDVRFFSAQL